MSYPLQRIPSIILKWFTSSHRNFLFMRWLPDPNNRGISSIDQASKFINPDLSILISIMQD